MTLKFLAPQFFLGHAIMNNEKLQEVHEKDAGGDENCLALISNILTTMAEEIDTHHHLLAGWVDVER